MHPITEDLRWKELQEKRIIKAPVPAYKPLEDDGTVIVPAEQVTEQCFRIYSVNVDTASHEVTVEARHISYAVRLEGFSAGILPCGRFDGS